MYIDLGPTRNSYPDYFVNTPIRRNMRWAPEVQNMTERSPNKVYTNNGYEVRTGLNTIDILIPADSKGLVNIAVWKDKGKILTRFYEYFLSANDYEFMAGFPILDESLFQYLPGAAKDTIGKFFLDYDLGFEGLTEEIVTNYAKADQIRSAPYVQMENGRVSHMSIGYGYGLGTRRAVVGSDYAFSFPSNIHIFGVKRPIYEDGLDEAIEYFGQSNGFSFLPGPEPISPELSWDIVSTASKGPTWRTDYQTNQLAIEEFIRENFPRERRVKNGSERHIV